MVLTNILTAKRIAIDHDGSRLKTSRAVLEELARLLSADGAADEAAVLKQLSDRERLQSTGIGDGVAIPHTAVQSVVGQKAALLLCPAGVDFDAIDSQPVRIFFGVIGPKSAASEHLKILARVSRLLRSPETRRRLLESDGPEQAYSLIEEHEVSSITP